MVEILLKDRWLVVSFDEPYETRSWAIYGGPRKITQKIVWYQVKKGDLSLSVDAKEFAKNIFVQNAFEDVVGMLTGAALSRYIDVQKTEENLSVRSIATIGTKNALRVGDHARSLQPAGTIPSPALKERVSSVVSMGLPGRALDSAGMPLQLTVAKQVIGTINLLCAISAPLSEEAFLEAMSIAVEARTTAVLEFGISSSTSGLQATGTGTDCIVVAAPAQLVQPPLEYAGKHTRVGSLIGRSVLEAVNQGLKRGLSNCPRKEVSL